MTGINKANLQEIQRLIEILDEHITSNVFKLSGGLKLLNENNEVLGFISHGDDGWEFSTPVSTPLQAPHGFMGSGQAAAQPLGQLWNGQQPRRITSNGVPLESRSPGSGEPIMSE